MGRLTGKVAIITGGGQGCGLGIAQAYADAGASMVITGRVQEKLQGVIPDLEARGAKVVACPGDAGVRESAQRAVQAAIDAFGRLDIVVNNAQAARPGPQVQEITDEDLAQAFGSGFLGTLYHMQAAFPHLQTQGGSVINFGSRVGILPLPGQGAYAATKEAIRGLSRIAAKEWGQFKIRVNVIIPAALTAPAVQWMEDFPDQAAQVLADFPMGRFGDAEKDIGPVAVFLGSDDSGYVSGQTINIDGGLVMM